MIEYIAIIINNGDCKLKFVGCLYENSEPSKFTIMTLLFW